MQTSKAGAQLDELVGAMHLAIFSQLWISSSIPRSTTNMAASEAGEWFSNDSSKCLKDVSWFEMFSAKKCCRPKHDGRGEQV
jgi:hypothetical protein